MTPDGLAAWEYINMGGTMKLFKSSSEKIAEKRAKRYSEMSGRRTINAEEIRNQLIFRGQDLVDEMWGRVKNGLIIVAVTLPISLFALELLAAPLACGFFSLIAFFRFYGYYSDLRDFKKTGRFWEEELVLLENDRSHVLHFKGSKRGFSTDISCSLFRPSKQKAVQFGYSNTIRTTIVAIIDEDGTGYWYDPIEEDD